MPAGVSAWFVAIEKYCRQALSSCLARVGHIDRRAQIACSMRRCVGPKRAKILIAVERNPRLARRSLRPEVKKNEHPLLSFHDHLPKLDFDRDTETRATSPTAQNR